MPLPIYEIDGAIAAPMVKTHYVDKNNLRFTVSNRKNIIFQMGCTTKPFVDILQILNELEEGAKKHRIKKVQWEQSDFIFGLYTTIEDTKRAYLQQQRKLKIVLVSGIKYVETESERNQRLREAHVDAQTNEHYPKAKTTKRLLAKFYWERIAVSATSFVKSCEECKNENA